MEIRLTERQVGALSRGVHWSEKKEHTLKLIRSFGIDLQEERLEWFMEDFLPFERTRVYKVGPKIGRGRAEPTSCDSVGGYEKVEKPEVGRYYRIGWASIEDHFRLVKIEKGRAYLDNMKHAVFTLVTCPVQDLRNFKRTL